MESKERIYFYQVDVPGETFLVGESEALREEGFCLICRVVTDKEDKITMPIQIKTSLVRPKKGEALETNYTISLGGKQLEKMSSIAGGLILENKGVVLSLAIQVLYKELQEVGSLLMARTKDGKHKFISPCQR